MNYGFTINMIIIPCLHHLRIMVIPRQRRRFQAKKMMITFVFTATKLLVLNSLFSDQPFTQHYFVSEVISALTTQKVRFQHCHLNMTFPFLWIILVVIMRELEWLNLRIKSLDELHTFCTHQIWSPMTFDSLSSLREAEWSEATWCLCFSSCDHRSLRRAEFWEYPDCVYGMDGLPFFDHSKQGRILY
jgi:hypothetical protein